MKRDKLKDKSYFLEYINYQEERYLRFENIKQKVIQERGRDDPAAMSIHFDLLGFQFNKLFAMYSIGNDVEEIRAFIPSVIDNLEKVDSSYYHLLTMLSIVVLTGIDENENNRLKEIVDRSEEKDFLIDFLLNYLNPLWKIESTEYQFKIPYAALDKVIKCNEKDISIKNLKIYLQNLWYKGHSDMGWHDTHKIEDDYIYSGYWSFESGAIAKILQLDDSSLKDTPYYPYDMVHYQES